MTDPQNVGHGHVFPRPDGVKARCGGPAMCSECARDLGNGRAPAPTDPQGREPAALDLDQLEAICAEVESNKRASIAEQMQHGWRASHLLADAAPALIAEVRALRDVLVFADGLMCVNADLPIAALYAEDAPAQAVLQRAGCWPREHRP